MELENELFLATIEWTWECCLKLKESDNEKSVALCKAYTPWRAAGAGGD